MARGRLLHSSLLPLGLVIAAVLWVVWPLFSATPLSHDHPVHIFKAWHFWTDMLGRGRLRGWSHVWAFGFPSGELTPLGPELWVALFRATTLGSLSWLRTYSVALAGMLCFTTLAFYQFAKHFFGRWTAALAALLFLFDPGAWGQGGWYWHTTYGVWPVTLAMGFALLALVQLDKVLSSRVGRHSLWAGLLVAISLLIHQLPLVAYAVAVPLLLVERATSRTGISRGCVRRLGLALSLGMALPAFYLVPMFVRSSWTLDLGTLPTPLKDIVFRLVDLHPFDNMWALLSVSGVVGMIFVLRARLAGGFFLVAAAIVFVVLSSNFLVIDLHAERLMKNVLKIETMRMLLIAKLFWLTLAAHGLVAIFPRVPLVKAAPWPKRLGRWAAGLAIAIPLLPSAVGHIAKTQVGKAYQMEATTPYWKDLQPFFAWSRVERKTSSEFYRIAYDLPFHDHLSVIAPVFNNTLYYKLGYTPAQQFRSFPMSQEPELFAALSVKYLLSDHKVEKPDFQLVRDFGALHLYRFARYRESPFSMNGPGEAKLERFEPERIQIRLKNTRPDSRIKLHVAGFDRWQASLDGVQVPIDTATVYGSEYPILMELPARDGELELRYVRRLADWIGLFVSLGALLLAAVGLALRRRFVGPLATRMAAWCDARSSRLRWLALGGAGVLVGLAAARMAIPRALLPQGSIFRSVSEHDMSLDGYPCHETGVLSWHCGGGELTAKVTNGAYGVHYCLSASAANRLTLDFKGALSPLIETVYDSASDNPGHIAVTVNGAAVFSTDTRPAEQGLQQVRFDAHGSLRPAANSLHVEVSGAALHCFDLLLVTSSRL